PPRRPIVIYPELTTETNGIFSYRSYLATEEGLHFLKQLEARNLVVPVVGDFGGPKAIRAIAAYLKRQNAVISTFYLSNVEQYLLMEGAWSQFCENVGVLPLDAASTFIRSTSLPGVGGCGLA